MTLDYFTQAWIVLFGGVAMWLMAGATRRSRYCGAWLGLINQPAWYVQMVLHGQWIMAPIYVVYTIAWIRGVLNNRKPAEPAAQDTNPRIEDAKKGR